jgi:DNA-binding transcriptional regulator YhcF (GntR family)
VKLDPTSPVPLYHQIAEAIRYRIATGALAPGDLLPPLREAAARWGVNLHTVRRAYAQLGEQGVTETAPPVGTRVLGAGRGRASARAEAAREFLVGVVREARERHGLSVDRLVAGLQNLGASPDAAAGIVHVVECSETQAHDLARQLAARWRVDARGFSLDQPGPPPPGPVVATYFHYNDVRARCRARPDPVRFLAIRPDPALADRLAAPGRGRRRQRVVLCERDAPMASSIAADLAELLPAARFAIDVEVTDDPGALLGRADRGPVLFSPRVWGELEAPQRQHPRAFEVRYLFEPADLEAVGAEMGWSDR